MKNNCRYESDIEMTLKLISTLCWPHFGTIQPGGHGLCWLAGSSPTCTEESWRLRIHFKFCDVTKNTKKFSRGKGHKANERCNTVLSQKYRFIKDLSVTIWPVCSKCLVLISEHELRQYLNHSRFQTATTDTSVFFTQSNNAPKITDHQEGPGTWCLNHYFDFI